LMYLRLHHQPNLFSVKYDLEILEIQYDRALKTYPLQNLKTLVDFGRLYSVHNCTI